MKKRVVVMMLAFALSVGTMAGCGDKANEKPATKTEASDSKDDAKETKDPEEEATENKEKSESSDYSSWTGKEWKAASDDEKKEAGKYFLVETTKATTEAAGQEWTDQIEAAAITDQAVEAEIMVLDQMFAADESLKMSDLIKQTTEAAGAIMDQATQQPTE